MSFLKGFIKQADSLEPKVPYGTKKFHQLDPRNPNEVWSTKIDGAHTIAKFKKGELPDLYSHRRSKRTGGKIDYVAKLPHIKRPSKINGEFRVETFATDPKGTAVEPEVVTSILNRTVPNSLDFQKKMKLTPQTALIDVEKYEGKDYTQSPFSIKREVLEGVVKKHPEFTLPDLARTPKEKERIKTLVLHGKHPQTKEGLIVHEVDSPKFYKAKIFNEHDVYVRDIFHEEGKREPMAGGFTYSWSPDGEVKGRVGTGFTHAEKREMFLHPERYIGRVARVQATKVSRGRALLKPSFKHWHVEKNIGLDKQATIFAKQSIIVDKSHEPDRDRAQEIAKKFADRIYTSRGTKTQWRFRQRPPHLFVPNTFRHAKIKPGISIIYGQIDEKRKKN